MLESEDGRRSATHPSVKIWDKESGQRLGCIGTTTSPHEKNYSLNKLTRIKLQAAVVIAQCGICNLVYVLDEKGFGFKPEPE